MTNVHYYAKASNNRTPTNVIPFHQWSSPDQSISLFTRIDSIFPLSIFYILLQYYCVVFNTFWFIFSKLYRQNTTFYIHWILSLFPFDSQWPIHFLVCLHVFAVECSIVENDDLHRNTDNIFRWELKSSSN